jgi:hypothetical protein
MVEFDPKWPQEFDKGSITVLLKDNNGKLYLSKEMSELYTLVQDEAEKLLDWVKWYNSSAFEKIDFIPEDKNNNDYSFVSANIKSFVLENYKIILDNEK